MTRSMAAVTIATLVAAACGGARRGEPAARPVTGADGDALVLEHDPCQGPGPWLTIETGRLADGCEGGVYLLDGRYLGTYPVACGLAVTGKHQLTVESAGDCAGMGGCEIELVAGAETVVDLRHGCAGRVLPPPTLAAP